MSDKVFYTGASMTFPCGNKLVHGQQGEVVGPGTGSNRTEGKGLCVLFPGNKVAPGCFLTEVCRLNAASAATPPLAPQTHDAAHAPRARPPSHDALVPVDPSPTASVAARAVARPPAGVWAGAGGAGWLVPREQR